MVQGRFRFRHLSDSQLGFARVSSHPLLGFGMTPDDAFGVLRRLLADPRHRFIPDDLSSADRAVRTDLMTGANQITDRYLIALARQHGCSLATLDEPLAKSFAGSEPRPIGPVTDNSRRSCSAGKKSCATGNRAEEVVP